jgi:biotin transport system ATP-binding protein
MIAVNGLTHRYDDTIAVDDVSLSVEDGEYVVIAGANGSGKTTLVRHFNGLLEPDDGTVRVNGVDVTEEPLAARTGVGMVFQAVRDQIVASTVGADVAFGPENLGLEREAIDERVDWALSAVNMTGRRTDRISELSGGEIARVAIAGALAMKPDHLVLDEPLAGLDVRARRSVVEQVRSLAAEGTGVVVVTHDLDDVIDDADRVVVLADGTVVEDGPAETVRGSLETVGVREPRC